MPCTITLATALSALAARLYDETNQFWSQAELTLYIQEAMRTWNALTGYWRGDFSFSAASGTTWYDLTAQTGSLRPQTLTPTSLYTVIEYHLLEPPTGAGSWTGSAQFALSDIQNAVTQRLNELIGASGCFITLSLVPGTPGRITLAATTLDLRRVAFIPQTGLGLPSTLWPDDLWGWQSFEPGYATLPQGIPQTYAQNTQPLLTFDVDTNLNVPGQYELLTTQAVSGAAVSSLAVPDDWAWVVKWGALGDLLGRESNAKDTVRQKYAEQRYAEGMSLLTLAPALLGFRVNNVPVEVDSVRGADLYNPTWESATPGAPLIAMAAGLNLVALTPVPDGGGYSLTATVVENCPVPSLTTDCVNVTEDVYEALLDYAQHLCAFKMGGAEFLATIPMYQRFLSIAAIYSSRIAEMGEFSQALYALSRQEASMAPRLTADTPSEVTNG